MRVNGLLTYKSVSGERRDGTLTLVLSNPLPRSLLLLAKYCAAMLALSVAFVSAILFSLITLHILGTVGLSGDDMLKIFLFGSISLVFLSILVETAEEVAKLRYCDGEPGLCKISDRTMIFARVWGVRFKGVGKDKGHCICILQAHSHALQSYEQDT